MPPWTKTLKKIIIPYGITGVQAKRIIKASVSTSICFILVLINPVDTKLSSTAYLCAMVTVSLHPGRRLGAMIQTFCFSLIGIGIALGYTSLAHYTGNLIYKHTGSLQNSLGLFTMFEIIMLAFVGYVRSMSARLFPMVFIIFLIVHFSFMIKEPFSLARLNYSYSIPILTAMAVNLTVNIILFPEFGSTYIGNTITSALHQMQTCLYETTTFFTTVDKKDTKVLSSELGHLLAKKKKIRSVFQQCEAVMQECTFEISYAFMSPRELKPVMKSLKQIGVRESALIVACEHEFSVFSSYVSDRVPEESIQIKDSKSTSFDMSNKERRKILLDSAKPHKEAEYADKEILLKFLETVKAPVLSLLLVMSESMDRVKYTLATCYDVPMSEVPNAKFPIDFESQSSVTSEIDKDTYKIESPVITPDNLSEQLSDLAKAIHLFDVIVKKALSDISSDDNDNTYIMPRDEYFLLSSFLLNYRETALVMTQLLEYTLQILETRKKRQSKGYSGKKLWFSVLYTKRSLKKFMKSGFVEPADAMVASIAEGRSITDDTEMSENVSSKSTKYTKIKQTSTISDKFYRIRTLIADFLDTVLSEKEHLKASFQTVFLVMLLSFPVFSASMRDWYIGIRGNWAGFMAMMAMETSVGATIYTLITRAVLLVVGSSWGLALYSAGNMGSNRYVMSVLFMLAMPVFFYILLVAPFGKSGAFAILSCILVPLATLRTGSVPGNIVDSFVKRVIALLVGGTSAVLVQAIIFPKKARVLLIEELIVSLKFAQKVQNQLGLGLDKDPPSEALIVRSDKLFSNYMKKARNALTMSEAYLNVTRQEPRLKGSFKDIQFIYREMCFALNQILDRYDTIKFMRQQYGSAVLRDLHPYVYSYRRDVYAGMLCSLRAVEEAVHTKRPLPQFLPSARIAHMRLINEVRHTLIGVNTKFDDLSDSDEVSSVSSGNPTANTKPHKMLLKRYMGWSATSGAMEEIIEYQEELVGLSKLLVGYNSFKFGFLSRPIYETWANVESKTSSSSSYNNSNDYNMVEKLPSFQSEIPTTGEEVHMLERKSTLEPSKLFKRKNSVLPHQTHSMIAEPQTRHNSFSEELLENELPITMKRVLSRRYTASDNKKLQ